MFLIAILLLMLPGNYDFQKRFNQKVAEIRAQNQQRQMQAEAGNPVSRP